MRHLPAENSGVGIPVLGDDEPEETDTETPLAAHTGEVFGGWVGLGDTKLDTESPVDNGNHHAQEKDGVLAGPPGFFDLHSHVTFGTSIYVDGL